METYHTEGTIKTIELVGNKPTIILDPVSPYRFSTKKDGKEIVRILFEENEDEFHPIIVLSKAGTESGIHVEIADSVGGGRKPVPAVELSCKKTDGVLTVQKPDAANKKTTLAFLLESDAKFSIKDDLNKQVNFASLLSLKQNRTKIRINVFLNNINPILPVQIENVSICE